MRDTGKGGTLRQAQCKLGGKSHQTPNPHPPRMLSCPDALAGSGVREVGLVDERARNPTNIAGYA